MRFKTPVTFEIDVTFKRGRTVKRENFGIWLTHEIPEVSDFDAPVALQWRESPRRLEYRKVESDLVQLRYYDGNLWEPVTQGTDDDQYIITSQEISENPFHSSNPLTHNDLRLGYFKLGQIPSFDPITLRSYNEIQLRLEQEKALSRQDTHILVEGGFWRRCIEPKYQLDIHSNLDAYYSVDITGQPSNLSNTFRIDRFDDFVEFAAKQGHQVPHDRCVDVLIPEAVKFDDERSALIETLGQALNLRPGVVSTQRETIPTWIAARDAISALKADFNDDMAEQAIIDTQIYLSMAKVSDQSRNMIGIALERWHLRPLSYSLDDLEIETVHHGLSF